MKYLNWLIKINMPIPLVNPTITGLGIKRIYLPSFNNPIMISKMPAKIIEATKPSNPYLSAMLTSTTVIAPVGPEICALVPPNIEAKIPVQMAPYTPAAAPAPDNTPKLSANGSATKATEIPPIMSPFKVDRISFCINIFTFSNKALSLLLSYSHRTNFMRLYHANGKSAVIYYTPALSLWLVNFLFLCIFLGINLTYFLKIIINSVYIYKIPIRSKKRLCHKIATQPFQIQPSLYSIKSKSSASFINARICAKNCCTSSSERSNNKNISDDTEKECLPRFRSV